MTDTLATPRFGLPLLAVAQAQKEVTHNEALTLLDALLHPAVEDGPLSTPPGTPAPAPGQGWIVGTAPTGAWEGQDGAIALWTGGGWRFVAAREGMRIVRLSDGAWLCFHGGMWVAPATIDPPGGGAVIDVEARAALVALLASLEAQGLMISG
ncbi:DUF2793 domain-containing protein [Sphingopyxis alaskensis]|uniref:DUF2793 domain-containing protein n=1 Tax=Sphingopyxis alaskensis TaxID=117207 RepID=UPI00391926B9